MPAPGKWGSINSIATSLGGYHSGNELLFCGINPVNDDLQVELRTNESVDIQSPQTMNS